MRRKTLETHRLAVRGCFGVAEYGEGFVFEIDKYSFPHQYTSQVAFDGSPLLALSQVSM